jgi:MOB kinase activator 1
MFNAGPHYHYFWEDESTVAPVQLSTPEYLMQLKRWAFRQLANPELFPKTDGVPLSEEAKLTLRTIFRRTTRILAHLYLCHFKSIKEFRVEPVINTILVHYTLFALRYDMIQAIDVEMLAPVYAAMKIDIPGLGK